MASQVPNKEAVQERQNPSWEDFIVRGDKHVYYGENYQRVRLQPPRPCDCTPEPAAWCRAAAKCA